MSTKVIYPGSFDPVTNGHLDLIRRASVLFDEVIVAVLNNPQKTPLFSVEERVKMLEDVTKDFPNVSVESFSGLLVDYAREKDVNIAIRGLRALTDFDYELHMAQTNTLISNNSLDTIFIPTDLQYSYLASSTVREVARFKGDIADMVPSVVASKLYEKFEYKLES